MHIDKKQQRYLSGRIFLCLSSLLFWACMQEPQDGTPKNASVQDSLAFVYKTLNVDITLAGYLEPYPVETLRAFDSLKVISVLVEKDQRVKKGDLLLSVWDLWDDRDYTPANYYAPFDGEIIDINVRHGGTYPQNSSLITIAENRILEHEAIVKEPGFFDYVKGGQTAEVIANGDTLYGKVAIVDRDNNIIKSRLENPDQAFWPGDLFLECTVHTGPQQGAFLHTKFAARLPQKIEVGDSFFEIKHLGSSDSLIFVGDLPLKGESGGVVKRAPAP